MTAHTDPMTAASSPVPVAMVTGSDLLQRLDHLSAQQAVIVTKVDSIPAQIERLHGGYERNRADIDRLMQWRSFWAGITAVLTLILSAGVVGAYITAVHH